MERWKELLTQDLENVKKGYQETGKDASNVIEAIENIPDLDKDPIVALLVQNELRYFAGKLDAGEYDKTVELEQKEQDNGTATS
jgi:hypothetical protein